MAVEVFVHCIYVGNKKFRLHAKTDEAEQTVHLSEAELDQFIDSLSGGSYRVGDLVITANSVVMAQVREYLELILSSYRAILERGDDPDSLLEKQNGEESKS